MHTFFLDFLQSLEHHATQTFDPASDYNIKHMLLDHRHFRFKEFEEVKDHNGEVIYSGPVLAIHIKRIWNTLQDHRTAITKEISLSLFESHLQNSSYFIDKSALVLLTKSLGAKKESNVRCYQLNVKELFKKGMLEELIEKSRVEKLSF
ncbi:hypothetical protein BH23BAC3_BH23BAC3_35380 [soil metagenome]